jgi:hypothetical protein
MVMKRWLLVFSILIPLYLPTVTAQVTGKVERLSLYDKELFLLGEGRRGPYLLPDSLIIKDSERVLINEQAVPKSAYELNYINGELRFVFPVPEKASIHITYKKSPLALPKSFSHRPLVQRVLGAATELAAVPTAPPKSSEEDYAGQLNKSGSITRGVTVGSNRGLKVNSSLNLNVSGKVADNVEVVAALTDQSTPLQPEGTTQNLQEIDKVFVQVKAPHLSATMGDYYLELSESQFARYSRKLQGAMGKADYPNVSLTVSGAVSRGKYFSMTFNGQEGNQGPYQLKGDRGQIDIIVLAGTERVFIDGEAMVRGETNDYIIDYSTAQVTFTRRRLITADSRIVVDFQYSDEKYRRSLYAARAAGQLWHDRVALSATFLREADDSSNPLDFTLSEEKLATLRAAGDDPSKAVQTGISYVGPGNGTYSKTDDGYFRYTGSDSGDYRLTFSDMGEGLGSYRYRSFGIYDYVGKGQGRYEPVQLLTTANSHNLADFTMTLKPVKGVTLQSEVALSALDLNTFSNLDDQDNDGMAQNWRLNIKPDSLRFLGRRLGSFEMQAHYQRVEDRFQDIDRTTEVEYNRRWDLPSSAPRGEEVREWLGRYQPWSGYSLNGEYGSIQKGDYFSSTRWQFENRLNRRRWPDAMFRVERIVKDESTIDRSGDWLRQRGSFNYRLGKFTPLVDYEAEVKKENWSDSLHTGFRFYSYNGGLEFKPSSKISTTAKVAFRDDEDYSGLNTFTEKSKAITQSLAVRLQQWKALSGSVEFTHRQRTFADSTEDNKNTDLAEVRLNFSPWRNAVSSDVNYQISNTATAKKEPVYIQVSPGDGNYRFDKDLNEYVNDPLGDLVMRTIVTDELIPVVELKASTRLQLSPARFFAARGKTTKTNLKTWQKVVSALSSETYVNVEERTQEKDVWQVYLLNQSKFRQPVASIYGNLQFRQDLFVFESRRDFSLRLRYQRRDEVNNQYVEGGQNRLEREYNARLTNRYSERWSSQTEVIHKRTARFFGFSGRQNRDVYANQARIDLSFRPRSALEVAMESRISREEDRFYEDPTRVTSVAILPRVTYAVKSKGRLRGELEYSNVSALPKGRVIPYEMANGRSIGQSFNWDLRFDYRVSVTIQASISYSGRNEPQRRGTIHTGRAQVTAAFR